MIRPTTIAKSHRRRRRRDRFGLVDSVAMQEVAQHNMVSLRQVDRTDVFRHDPAESAHGGVVQFVLMK